MFKDTKVIFVMTGIPGSGKSSYVSNLIGKYNLYEDVVIISSDDYIDFFATTVGKTYNDVFTTAIKGAKHHMDLQLMYALENTKPIIWDQTNLTKRKRKEILDQIPDDYMKISVFVDTPLEIALERNQNRLKIIPEHIIKNMHESLEKPHITEGFHKLWKEG